MTRTLGCCSILYLRGMHVGVQRYYGAGRAWSRPQRGFCMPTVGFLNYDHVSLNCGCCRGVSPVPGSLPAHHRGRYAEARDLCGASLGNVHQTCTPLARSRAAYDLHRCLSAAGHQGESPALTARTGGAERASPCQEQALTTEPSRQEYERKELVMYSSL